jgi:hypothetical protein
MKYILKDNRFYFTGLDGVWPTWMTDVNAAKRYNTLKELEEDKKKIPSGILKNPEILEVER